MLHSCSLCNPFLQRSGNLLNFNSHPDFHHHILTFHSFRSRYQSPLWEINPGCLGWELQRWTWSPGEVIWLSCSPSVWTTMAGLSNPETPSVSEGSTLPAYTRWPVGALAGPLCQVGSCVLLPWQVPWLIEVSEVKRVSGAGGHPKTM